MEPSCGTTHSYSQSSHGLFTAFFPFPSLSSSPEVVIYINIIPEKPTISDLIFVERISNSLEFSAYWSQKFRVSFVFAYWNNEQQLISRCQRWLHHRSSGFHEKTRQPARATSPENSGSHPQSFSRVRLYCFVFFWAHNPEEKLNKEKSLQCMFKNFLSIKVKWRHLKSSSTIVHIVVKFEGNSRRWKLACFFQRRYRTQPSSWTIKTTLFYKTQQKNNSLQDWWPTYSHMILISME